MSEDGETRSAFDALQSGASIADLDDRALLVATGEDRVSFLQGMLSNEVASVEPGAGNRALLLTEQGRVVADLRVYALDDAIWLDAPASARDDVRAALERFIVADDVEIESSPAVGLAVRGPGAVAAVSKALGVDLDSLPVGAHRAVDDGRVARVDDLGVGGVHLWTDAAARQRLREVLAAAGGVAATADALEAQRVVARVGRLGAEFGLDTLAPEVPSLEDAISYRKGCYLGQEVVERVAARGKVNWKVVGLRVSAPVAPGAEVRVEAGGVGTVTSVAERPDDRSTWALARVRATHAAPGTELEIAGDGGACTAEVVGPAEEETKE